MSIRDSPDTLWIDIRPCQTSALHYLGMLLEDYPELTRAKPTRFPSASVTIISMQRTG